MLSLCKKQAFLFFVFPAVIWCLTGFTGWRITSSNHLAATWIYNCISPRFNESEGVKLKKWEFSVSEAGFLRLRKFFPGGKEEYFSFNLSRLSSMVYLGTVNSGYIVFKTRSDDVIVQTYNDRKGNIDSMATSMKLPVVNMEPEQLDSLDEFVKGFKGE